MIGVGLDGFNRAHRKATGIDLVSAGGENLFAHLDPRVGGEIVDDNLPSGTAAKNCPQTGGGEQNPSPGGLVVDEQYLRGVRKNVAEFSDDAVGRDDRLIGLETVLRALVDIKDLRQIVSAGADNLGRHS